MEFRDAPKTLLQFLERYKNFAPPALVISRAVRAAVEERVGITISEKDIQVSRGVAHIRLGGVQKSEILLHKEEIVLIARAKAGDSLRDLD